MEWGTGLQLPRTRRLTKTARMSLEKHQTPKQQRTGIQGRYGNSVVLRVGGSGQVNTSRWRNAVRVAAAVEDNVVGCNGGRPQLLYEPVACVGRLEAGGKKERLGEAGGSFVDDVDLG
jgi:hypothetical protein